MIVYYYLVQRYVNDAKLAANSVPSRYWVIIFLCFLKKSANILNINVFRRRWIEQWICLKQQPFMQLVFKYASCYLFDDQ